MADKSPGQVATEAVRKALAGPLRVKVTLENAYGAEVIYLYPLGSRTVEYGQTVHIDFEVGVTVSPV